MATKVTTIPGPTHLIHELAVTSNSFLYWSFTLLSESFTSEAVYLKAG